MSGSKELERLAAMLQARRNGQPIREIARQHHLSARTYRLIELGKCRPQIRTCYRLAGLLNVEPSVVLRLAGYDS
jgi:transcriptional regulator with XRE-family HTH domain